jgi:hypothetical protein
VSTLEELTTGSSAAVGGQSHSSERPTSRSNNPSSETISVALGSSETTRVAPAMGGEV